MSVGGVRVGGDEGAVTVEAALAVASIVAVIVVCIGAIVSVTMHIGCVDAAREAARLMARGDGGRAVSAAQRIAPDGARISVVVDGEFVVARVEVPSPLPGLTLSAEAVAAPEEVAAQ